MNIALHDIVKTYGNTNVLRRVNWEIAQGEIYCLMGPSGTGKTTLLRVLLGLEEPDSGSIEGIVPGQISAMFQEDRLCETLTPVENVALVMPGSTSRRRVRHFLEEILPHDCMKRPAMQLSGGMRRRVSLARAVAYDSQVIVLDEPFTGLDEDTKKSVIAFLLNHRQGRTLIVSTHSSDDVELLGGRKVMLQDISRGGL